MLLAVALATGVYTGSVVAPPASADNRGLHHGLVQNVYTMHQQAACTQNVRVSPRLQLAAQWHSRDVLNNRDLGGDVGSDGSTVPQRAAAAGYRGDVAETVAVWPALAISGLELLNLWYDNPDYRRIMQDCANTDIGVWSENALDRTVVVAVYGRPAV